MHPGQKEHSWWSTLGDSIGIHAMAKTTGTTLETKDFFGFKKPNSKNEWRMNGGFQKLPMQNRLIYSFLSPFVWEQKEPEFNRSSQLRNGSIAVVVFPPSLPLAQ